VLSDAALALIGTLPRVPGQEHVFPSARCPGRPIEGVRAAWARAKRAVGLPDDLRLHDLRHNFARLLINTGGWSLYEVGQPLGHTQMATTARYAHLRQDRLVEAANTAGRIASGEAQPAPAEPRRPAPPQPMLQTLNHPPIRRPLPSPATVPDPTVPAREAPSAAPGLLQAADVARRLGVTVKALERWRGRGDGPRFVRLTRKTIRYRVEDVQAFVAERVRTRTATN
jgi:hypothetical protein